MIGEYTLKILCDKYNVSSDKILNSNNNILTYGEYKDIDDTLDYLINKLNINSINIEKCPSILYRNVDAIEKNIEFLKKQNINFSSLESCLHVLSSDSNNLKETYDYIEENYGILAINKLTSALSCSKKLIIEVEKLNLNKNWNLAISVSINFGITTLDEVKKIINSAEYKSHPELFTSTTLAHAKLEDIQKIIQSAEYKSHPELFTSTTLARAKLEDIQKLLSMPHWNDIKFEHLLTSSIVSKAKQMINKLPVLFNIAKKYQIEEYINTSFLLFSPSQNYALINYLQENKVPLIINGKLNPIFGKQPGVLSKSYGIDIKKLIEQYNYDENELGGKHNAVRYKYTKRKFFR